MRENVGRGRTIERRRTGEHVVEHDPEGVDVGATVQGIARRLLGTHVLRCSDYHAFAGEGRAALLLLRSLRRFRDPEVRHQDVAAPVEQDVVGLDVAMHDLVAMRVRERIRDLPGDARRVADGKLLLRLEELAQRGTVDAPHDEVEDFFPPADLVDRHDVRMLEARHRLCFAHEAFAG